MTVKRFFDISLAVMLLIILFVPMLVISAAIKLTSRGAVFYISERAGRGNSIFRMLKFRTMKTDTPAMATHLLISPEDYMTPIGYFLRKSSIDEIPQLINILKGDMSFVGPRPALFNQYDLIQLRTEYSIHELLPGLTGWAQVNGRDELPIPVKVSYDSEYKKKQNFMLDLKILIITLLKVLKKEGVSH
jgi:O-antigen biosynthesis protein WbqP